MHSDTETNKKPQLTDHSAIKVEILLSLRIITTVILELGGGINPVDRCHGELKANDMYKIRD